MPIVTNLIFNAHKVVLEELCDFSTHPSISGLAEDSGTDNITFISEMRFIMR